MILSILSARWFCHLVNDLLETKGLFLRVYERCDKFRFVIKKGVAGKINITRDLPSCVIQKFNEYEVLKPQLKCQEKQFHKPIDIIFEPVIDNSARACFFTDSLYLAYRSYYLRNVKGEQQVIHPSSRQCYYCNHHFVSKLVFENHIKRCSNIAGIVYKFKNKKIISFRAQF